MIVEITGPSSVGKTTLITQLVDRLQKQGVKTGAIHSQKINYHKQISSRLAQVDDYNIAMDLTIAPWAAMGLIRHWRFALFAIGSIIQLGERWEQKLAILRSFWRKIGLFHYLSRAKFNDAVIFVDEGLFHSSHNFLMSVDHPPQPDRVQKFAWLCPLSTCVILAKGSKSLIAARLKKRPDRSPRIRDENRIDQFATHSVMLYDMLSADLSSSAKMLIIECKDDNFEEVTNRCALHLIELLKPYDK